MTTRLVFEENTDVGGEPVVVVGFVVASFEDGLLDFCTEAKQVYLSIRFSKDGIEFYLDLVFRMVAR
jgi:hypothetical protein